MGFFQWTYKGTYTVDTQNNLYVVTYSHGLGGKMRDTQNNGQLAFIFLVITQNSKTNIWKKGFVHIAVEKKHKSQYKSLGMT